MDFKTFAEYLDVVADAVTTLATPLAIWAALLGLRTWRHQLKGNTEYELARRFLRSVYRVRDGIRLIRAPLMWLPKPEGEEKLSGAVEEQEKRLREGQKREYDRRFDELQKAWSELQVEVTEAEVLWGPTAPDSVKSLLQCIGELRGNLWLYFWLNEPKPAYVVVDRNPQRVEQVERTIFQLSDDPAVDKFWGKVLDAIKVAEEFIRPKLRV